MYAQKPTSSPLSLPHVTKTETLLKEKLKYERNDNESPEIRAVGT